MPIYEYRCENGHLLEVMQGMSDDTVSACDECGADYAKKKAPAGSGDSGDSKGGESKGESKSEAQGDSKSESKSSDA